MGYGSFGRSNSITTPGTSSPRRVIYCVHGKPSAGCCRVLEGEITDPHDEVIDISSHAKENSDTTRLSSYFFI